MKRVVHLANVHNALDVRIFYKEARTLALEGYHVTLVAQHERHENIDGIRIVPLLKPNSRVYRITAMSWKTLKLAITEKGDIYHIHDPELMPIGLLLKILGAIVVFDAHEDLPKQILHKEWIPRPIRALVAKGVLLAEKLTLWAYDGIVAATPAIARRFPEEKTVIVQNFPILSEFDLPRNTPHKYRPANIIYVGGITAMRGIREMVTALSMLPEKLDARLTLAGVFYPPSLERETQDMAGWERVRYIGWQGRDSVARLLGEARAGLVLFHPAPNHIEAWPNKLFEYMYAGLPVIASDFPLWREIIEKEQCGLLVNPLDPEAIAEAIQWVLNNPKRAEEMGKRGQEAVIKHYNWNTESKKLIELYKGLLCRR